MKQSEGVQYNDDDDNIFNTAPSPETVSGPVNTVYINCCLNILYY